MDVGIIMPVIGELKKIITDGKITFKKEGEVLNTLSHYINCFRKGECSTIYLPLASHLRGFGGFQVVISPKDSQQTYQKIEELIDGIMKTPKPITMREDVYVCENAIDKCLKAMRSEGLSEMEALNFIMKYFSINKELLVDILKILHIRGSIKGSWEAIEYSIIESSHIKAYEAIDRTALKCMHTIARFFDNMLIIVGAASHEPFTINELNFEEFGRGRKPFYTLLETPFTRALKHILEMNTGVDKYVEAYKKFIEYVVRSYINEEDPDAIINSIINRMKEYERINVDVEVKILRNSIRSLWKLLNRIGQYF